MTRTKILRLQAELVDKYGNVDMIHIVDEDTGRRVRTYKLTDITIENTADLKKAEDMAKNGKAITYLAKRMPKEEKK